VNCVFCDLIRTGAGTRVADEGWAVAFRPLPDSELAPGHTLVVPRAHREGLFGPSFEEFSLVMDLVRRVAAGMKDGLGATGTVVLQASGPDSGGSIAHLHFHVVPCWADDAVTFWPETRSAHTIAGDPHALIRAALSPPRPHSNGAISPS